MKSICGIDCDECQMKTMCRGCAETDGHPFGGECITCNCMKKSEEYFAQEKQRIIDEFNSLKVNGMPRVTELVPLCGSFVNLEYELPNGSKFKLLNDNDIYLGYQLEKDDERCFGIASDGKMIVVSEYGCNGADPVLAAYKKI